MQIRLLPVLLAAACAAGNFSRAAAADTPETKEQHDARMAWWREAKFGMFIHWGVYAVPAGTWDGKPIGGIGEWIMLHGKIPVSPYRAFAKDFTASKYDPAAWAALAKEAGMRYMVITSKHHDGFALFDSAVSDWDAVDASGAKRDLIAPLAKAARDAGLRFGLYYSQAQDWTHPGGAKSGQKDGEGWDAAHKGSFDAYLTNIAIPQTREILTQYQPDVIWWDTPHLMTQERAKPLHDLLALRPGIIANNRLGGGFRGDTETPEQHIPAMGFKNRDWETCMTLNDTWGFKSYDNRWKSTETLVRNLIDIVSKGGNYLLNVGPTAEGEIPQPSIDRLREVGAWMKVHGEAIYGTQASLFRRLPWGRCTVKRTAQGVTVYLHVFNWPSDGKLRVPGLTEAPRAARLVTTGAALQTKPDGDSLTISLPPAAPNALASVIALEYAKLPEITQSASTADAQGRITLEAGEAELGATQNNGLSDPAPQLEEQGGRQHIGYWTATQGTASWRFATSAAGRYVVKADVAAEGDSTGFSIMVDGKESKGSAAKTGGFSKFTTQTLGEIEAPGAGTHTLLVKPGTSGWNPINVRRIVLEPAK
jgi:alpha-L-fucosidase